MRSTRDRSDRGLAAHPDTRKRTTPAPLGMLARAEGVEPSSAARGCGSAVELCPPGNDINERGRRHHPFEGISSPGPGELETMWRGTAMLRKEPVAVTLQSRLPTIRKRNASSRKLATTHTLIDTSLVYW